MNKQTRPVVRPKTRLEIADELKISQRTLTRRIKKHGLDIPSGLICPQDQKKIYDALWYPSEE